jgi:putative ABC transport system ATP-binding protein
MNTILKLEHIQKYYGNEGNITKAIKDISFSVEAGEFLGIMGASGSGKTTLLNCISTIDTVSAGHIFLDGTDITEIKPKSLARFRRENLGFIFQDFNLLDTLTISENIALVEKSQIIFVILVNIKIRKEQVSLHTRERM